MKYIFCMTILLISCFFVSAQDPEKTTVKKPENYSLGSNFQFSNKVDNLELPKDQEVKSDLGFLAIKADCPGKVKWLVVSDKPIGYIPFDELNTIIVGVPPAGSSITVFAIGNYENKMTEFAKTVITVKDPKSIKPVESKDKSKPQEMKW